MSICIKKSVTVLKNKILKDLFVHDLWEIILEFVVEIDIQNILWN